VKLCLWAIAALLLVGAASAQTPIPERLLLSTGTYVGTGARALGMGGTYTGIADDYSAMWWNPAGLAQIKRIEMQGSLVRSGYNDDATYFGGSRTGATSAIRLNNLGLVFPVPVYQGAFSFAFGYNELTGFDDRRRVRAGSFITSLDTNDFLNYDRLETGRLSLWSFAAAIDATPNLALGLGVNYWTGRDEFTFTGNANPGAGYVEQIINTDLSGWGANFGALFRIGQYARLGAMVETPIGLTLKENFSGVETSSYSGYDSYKMTYPAVFRVGASVAPGRWLVATDIEYRDWTTMQFLTDPPIEGVSKAAANEDIKNNYQGTLRWSIGGEYLFPAYGLRARAGYALEPSNFQPDNQTHNTFGLGLGVLLDRSVMFDVGVGLSSFKQTVSSHLTKDVTSSNVLVTVSYRM
jgi:long-subunit fatty acid transport protein